MKPLNFCSVKQLYTKGKVLLLIASTFLLLTSKHSWYQSPSLVKKLSVTLLPFIYQEET